MRSRAWDSGFVLRIWRDVCRRTERGSQEIHGKGLCWEEGLTARRRAGREREVRGGGNGRCAAGGGGVCGGGAD
eukprot:3089986-Rhodomonas_salina.1